MSKVKTGKPITIGADPEFLIWRRNDNKRIGNIVRADSLLSDDITVEVGCDGCSSTGELRPRYSTTWSGLFKNIQELITNELPASVSPSRYEVTAGSGIYQPTGGHIHIGDPVNGNRRPSREVLDNFERFISNPLNNISNRDARYNYGRPMDWREQYHGYEYRTPLSWLSTPIICKGALCVAHIIARNSNVYMQTRDNLKSYAKNEREVKTIDAFYAEIDRIDKENIKLEEINIFQAWKKSGTLISPKIMKKVYAKKKYTNVIGTYFIECVNHGDYHMSDVFTEEFYSKVKCNLVLRIIGVRDRTYNENSIYIRASDIFANLYEYNMPYPQNFNIGKTRVIIVSHWDYGGSSNIAISRHLREKPSYCQNVLKKLVKMINNEEIV